ncbi:hypothetical protein GTW69_14325, partial [Streptomyces sp. SID7760]|nr:hypothetical protein [Streptomyces sp. SID7760]
MGELVIHRLGMALCLAVAALCTASAVTARVRARGVRRRMAVLLPVGAERRAPAFGSGIRVVARAWAGPAGALLAAWVLVGGWLGVLAGGAAAVGVRWLLLRARPPAGVTAREAERQLPFAADLLAACLAAGAAPVEAAEVVGESLGGPV